MTATLPPTSATPAAPTTRPARRAFLIVRWLLAFVLLFSFVLKTLEYFQTPPRDRLSTIIFVIGEAWLALWLITGFARRTVWCACLVVFGGLTCYLLYDIAQGDKSCGCFGSLLVPPWLTLCFDAAALLALLFSWPGRDPAPRPLFRTPLLLWTAVLSVVAGIVLGIYMYTC